jgi:hypothetical protein
MTGSVLHFGDGGMPPWWDIVNVTPNVAFSNTNLTVTANTSATGQNCAGRSNAKILTGYPSYWEVHLDALSISTFENIGVCNDLEPFLAGNRLGSTSSAGLGYDSGGFLDYNGTSHAAYAAYAQGNTICIAVNRPLIWFRVNNGNWNNDVIGNQNPATNTGGFNMAALLGSGNLYPAYNVYDITGHPQGQWTANFSQASWQFTAPAGYGPITAPNATHFGVTLFSEVWNPNNTGPNCTISNGGLTVQCTDFGNDQGTVATTSFAPTSSIYWSILVNAVAAGYEPIIGVCTSSFNVISNTLGSDNNSVGYSSNGDVSKNNTPLGTLPTYTNGDRIDVAVANGKIWYRKNGGNWNNDVIANQNPATNTGGFTHGLSGSLYPGVSGRANSQVTANFGPGSTYAIPAGFTTITQGTALHFSVKTPIIWSPKNYAVPGVLFANTYLTAQSAPNGFNDTGYGTPVYLANTFTYSEFLVNQLGTVQSNGVGVGSFGDNFLISINSFLGISKNSTGWFDNGLVTAYFANGTSYFPTIASFVAGTILCQAVDTGNNKIWWRANNGNWNNDVIGNQNPATNTGGFSLAAIVGNIYPAYQVRTANAGNAGTITANFTGPFTYPVPAKYSGFS